MNQPVVSVVITTKNEEKNIRNCLDSVQKQTYPQNKIEVIVVDNNSTDNTKKIASEYTQNVYNFEPERSAQRNMGAKKSTGEYYLYLDADMMLDPEVITKCVEKMQSDRSILALYIPEIIMGDSFWCQVRRFERSFYNGTVIDCVRFIRLDSFNDVQGFDETMSGPEDWDFDKKIRLKGKVDIIAAPVYHNEAEFNLQKYLNKKIYYAKSFKRYVSKWGKNDPDVRKQLGLYYRFVGVYMENGKWKKLISQPILTVGMYFLRLLIGIRYATMSLHK